MLEVIIILIFFTVMFCAFFLVYLIARYDRDKNKISFK